MSKSIIYVKRKSDDKILTDVINDSCQVHNIYDLGNFEFSEEDYYKGCYDDKLLLSDNDYNIGYEEGVGFYKWAEFEEVKNFEYLKNENLKIVGNGATNPPSTKIKSTFVVDKGTKTIFNNKEFAMEILSNMYDDWVKEETKNSQSGRGRRGVDGMLTTDKEKLFNQLMTVLEYQEIKKPNK